MFLSLWYLAALAAGCEAAVQYAGVNIAGFDFGCDISGNCATSKTVPPLSQLGGPDGAGQMRHFANDLHLNLFRLPVSWQYLTNNNIGQINQQQFANYDGLVQACLSTGASCIIDIHNYARWNGQIIGQGGPSNDQFANFWGQLASKYAGQSRVIFGVMNEPHDLNVATWAQTAQAAVTAIRNAGASSQMILVPGSSFSSLGAFPSESADALKSVHNPNGSYDNIVFDVHQYLDSDSSGTHTECTTDGTGNVRNLASWLKSNNRKALLSETGGGNTNSCTTDLCAELQALNDNSDVFLGWVGWAAGSFDQTYELVETPTYNGGSWADTQIVKSCIAGKF